MSDLKGSAKGRQTALVKVLYVVAALMAVIFVYMVISSITYMKSYLAAYGMTFSEMATDTIQYVITSSISYLVYAVLIFCAGKIIAMLDGKAEPAQEGAPADEVSEEAAPVVETPLTEDPVDEEVPAEEEAEETGLAAEEPIDGEASAEEETPADGEASAEEEAPVEEETPEEISEQAETEEK